MAVLQKTKKRRLSLTAGAIFARLKASRTASCSLNFVLGFMMSGARVMGNMAPFGIAAVARAPASPEGIFCLLGACTGYLLTGGFDFGVRYIASALLVFTVSFVLRDTKLVTKAWFMPCVAALVSGVTNYLNSFELFASVPILAGALTELTLTGGAAYFFIQATRPGPRTGEEAERVQTISSLVLCACLFISLANVLILDVISVGRFLALLLIMTAAFKGGALTGGAAGVAFGFAMDLAAGSGGFFSMAYAISGLISGFFSKHGRLLFLVGYIAVNTIAVIWVTGFELRMPLMYEVFAASVAFAVLPEKLLEILGSAAALPLPSTGEAGLRRYAAARANRLSHALRDLYGTVFRAINSRTNDNDVATVFDRASAAVCVNCKNKSDCWQKSFMDTLTIMNDATEPMLGRGKLQTDDLADRFLEKCPSVHTFVTAVNGELRALMYRRQFRSRLSENRSAAYGQYKDLADIVEGLAKDLQDANGADPLAERRLSRFLRAMDISADVSVFRDGRGRLHAIIESGRLNPLLRQENWLDTLSAVLGVRLCKSPDGAETTANRISVLEAEPLVVSVGIAGMKKKGEAVSGDRGTYFKTEQGVLCVILADGMGSGEAAAKESINAVRTLETFLRAGVDPAVAMKLLNSVLLLKNGEDWGYSTVDLMCVDLFTGEACFYKYGAAPSFVKNGKAIRRVRGESLAAGLCAGDGSSPDVVRMKLRPGNVALIASDGVSTAGDNWLREMLLQTDGRDAKALAKETLRRAAKENGPEDDMTVLALRVDERS
ncbi:MAG: SpoIIE family protein phosphatase [Oscillospiraceae bacterium]|jgi:stage II sporulation protein E|nr:SpoIIE family protein phosphatase [Oscillospiraceae bacterium]